MLALCEIVFEGGTDEILGVDERVGGYGERNGDGDEESRIK